MASLDYLRLATFDFFYATATSEYMRNWPGGWEPSRWLQYKGWRREAIFLGVGEQAGKRHFVTSASGTASNDLADFVRTWRGLYCTRIDLQRTIVQPKHAQLRRIRVATDCKNTTLIQSRENDTLYIGSRASDLFTRLYEKPLDTMWLRLEFELKGKRSRAAWRAFTEGVTPSQIFAHYLEKSKLPDQAKAWFAEPDDDLTFKADREAVLDDAKKKLTWLRSLDESMELAMGSHEIGEQVKMLVRAWSRFADKLDRDAAES